MLQRTFYHSCRLDDTDQDEALRTANGCYKEAADLAATLGEYGRAVEHYERVATASLNNPMTKYSVKEYYFKAGLCWLASAVCLALVFHGRSLI